METSVSGRRTRVSVFRVWKALSLIEVKTFPPWMGLRRSRTASDGTTVGVPTETASPETVTFSVQAPSVILVLEVSTHSHENSGVRVLGPSMTRVRTASVSWPSGTSPYQRTKVAPSPGSAVTVAVAPCVK